MHIPGENISWGDLLWRWMQPAGDTPDATEASVRYVEVATTPEDTLPDKGATSDAQTKAACEDNEV